MKTLKVYIENSVIGGYFDDEFSESTRLFFEKFRSGDYDAVISEHVIYELNKGAPQYVIDNLETLNYTKIDLTDEMEYLAKLYIENEIVTPKYFDDGMHIAIATVSNVDVVVSWNFRHIVNLDKIKKFNAVNLTEGYPILEIRTPKEMIIYE